MLPNRRSSTGFKGFTLKENLVMTPIEKHIYYNKYPWRLIANIALLVLVTAQVWIVFDGDASYSRQEQQTFRYLFIQQTDDHTPVINLYSPNDLQEHIQGVQDTYQNFNDKIFQTFDLDNAVFTIEANYKVPAWRPESYTVDMIEGFTEPFDLEEINSLKTFVENVVQMRIVARNLTVFNQASENSGTLCQNWTIAVNYDIRQFTQVKVTLESYSDLCGGSNIDALESTSIIVSFLIVVVAVISTYMSIQKINAVSTVFIRLKAGYINFMNHQKVSEQKFIDQQAQELADAAESPHAKENIKENLKYASWEDIPFTAKMKFFSPWFFFNMVGNVLQLVSSFIMILTFFSPISSQDFYVANIALGFSIFFTWTQCLQYLKFWDDVTLITTTLLGTANHIGVYFLICVPVFIGVGILGYSIFWKYDAFESIGRSLRSLFAMAGGDIVHDTLMDLWDEGFITTVYFVLYMILFYTSFVNIFVAVIMEGYDRSKMRKSLDNDDPFPTSQGIQKKGKSQQPDFLIMSAEEALAISQDITGYNLKGKLGKVLANAELEPQTKNTINLLLYYNNQAKVAIAELIKAKKAIPMVVEDKTTLHFLQNLMANGVNKLMERIFYLRLAYKKRSRKGQPKQQ